MGSRSRRTDGEAKTPQKKTKIIPQAIGKGEGSGESKIPFRGEEGGGGVIGVGLAVEAVSGQPFGTRAHTIRIHGESTVGKEREDEIPSTKCMSVYFRLHLEEDVVGYFELFTK